MSQNQNQSGAAFSLISRGPRLQFLLAIMLVSVIPLLAFAYLLMSGVPEQTVGRGVLWSGGVSVLLLVCLGYVLLAKYPLNVLRLRRYLESLAKNTPLKTIDLVGQEDDLKAIQACIQEIVTQTDVRIRTIEAQTQALVEAERQRVMLESLMAAAHHLGQPASVIIMYLELLGRKETSPETRVMLDEMLKAARSMSDTLGRFQNIAEYRTVPYLDDGSRMLDVTPANTEREKLRQTSLPSSAETGR
jgi:signal transduction histidine kinase